MNTSVLFLEQSSRAALSMRGLLLLLALLLTASAYADSSARDRTIDYLALYYAAQAGNEVLAEALLDRGAPVDAPDVDSAGKLSFMAADMNSPLQVAAENGNLSIVRLLLKHRPWVDHRCCTSPAALGLAAAAGHAEIVDMLLKAGADPSIKSEYGEAGLFETPLDAARRKGHIAVVRALEAALAVKAGH